MTAERIALHGQRFPNGFISPLEITEYYPPKVVARGWKKHLPSAALHEAKPGETRSKLRVDPNAPGVGQRRCDPAWRCLLRGRDRQAIRPENRDRYAVLPVCHVAPATEAETSPVAPVDDSKTKSVMDWAINSRTDRPPSLRSLGAGDAGRSAIVSFLANPPTRGARKAPITTTTNRKGTEMTTRQ